jgi:hypothetical protein
MLDFLGFQVFVHGSALPSIRPHQVRIVCFPDVFSGIYSNAWLVVVLPVGDVTGCAGFETLVYASK